MFRALSHSFHHSPQRPLYRSIFLVHSKMRAVRFHVAGGPLLIEDNVPVPVPGDDEVLIKVQVAGVNFIDTV